MSELSPDAGVVTVVDGHPLMLGWLGSVQRNPIHPLGVTRFGESGDLPDLYARHQIDTASIITAARDAAAWVQPRRRV